MAGVTDNYAVPFAIVLQASSSQVAKVVALPSLIAALAQPQANSLKRWMGSRKKLMATAVGLQVGCLLSMAAVPWFPERSRIPALILFLVAFAVLGGLVTPIWGSLMCDYLPAGRRSSYFGWRSRLVGGAALVSAVASGAALQLSGQRILWGFFCIFLAAAIARAISRHYLKSMFEPREYPAPASSTFGFLSANKNYSRYILACGAMSFSVNLFAPLFPIYLLRDLGMNYAFYTAMIVTSQAAMYGMMGRWGRSADRAGNMKVIQITARCLPLTALLWVFSTRPVFLIAMQLASGVIWAGYTLCTMNFVYDSVANNQRLQAGALFNMINGLAVFAGTLLGGWFLTVLPPLGGHAFYSLMILSAAARFGAGWFLFPRLREVRNLPAANDREIVFDLMGLVDKEKRVG